ncbi:hypothetical protein CC2G_008325 [Coprinopsis cinerea AmutBmut pab1-1]|nr:hypothetical protein CC2G_008325 [Coprinopsis cinerea AmutBmut pab1-1]
MQMHVLDVGQLRFTMDDGIGLPQIQISHFVLADRPVRTTYDSLPIHSGKQFTHTRSIDRRSPRIQHLYLPSSVRIAKIIRRPGLFC